MSGQVTMHKRLGLTLLEVVVALVLMGSVLVASLLAFSKHQRQVAVAQKRLQAVQVADQMVQQLSASPTGIPVPASGAVLGHSGWVWRTDIVGRVAVADQPLLVVQYRIFDVANRESSVPLVSVQVVKREGLR
jgi:Tfp pilus assembly protein PilV